MVYQNGLCYYSCLMRYVDNNQGGCVLAGTPSIPSTPSTGCNASQFLFGSNTCLDQCPQAYFGNISSRKC